MIAIAEDSLLWLFFLEVRGIQRKKKVIIRKLQRKLQLQKKSKVVRDHIPTKQDVKSLSAVGVQGITNQLEGGKELQSATKIMVGTASVAKSTMVQSKNTFSNRPLQQQKRKLNRTEQKENIEVTSSKHSNRQRTSTVTADKKVKSNKEFRTTTQTSNDGKKSSGVSKRRTLAYFLDKMQSQENQKDSIAKLVMNVVSAKMLMLIKALVTPIVSALLGLFLMIAVACIPVILVVAIIYNSPLAIFFPPLEEGDTVISVVREYEQAFRREVNTVSNEHRGYDQGEVVYVEYEGSEELPSNVYDILATYMVKYGVGETATVMNEQSKGWLKSIFDEMCPYTTTSATITTTDENGVVLTKTILQVRVQLKSYQDAIRMYQFDEEQVALLQEMMEPEYLAMLGFTPNDSGGGGPAISELSPEEIAQIVGPIEDSLAKQAVAFALSKVGYPYSQEYRHSGKYYDCSSLMYYAWKSAGVDIGYEGMTTAAAEGKGLSEAGKTISFEELKAGDLIFFSYVKNGRYLNISHVAMYVGDGKVVEAANTKIGVVYREIPKPGSIVLMGRP